MQVGAGWRGCQRYYGQLRERRFEERIVGNRDSRQGATDDNYTQGPHLPTRRTVYKDLEKREPLEYRVQGMEKREFTAKNSREASQGAASFSTTKIDTGLQRELRDPSQRGHSAQVQRRRNPLPETSLRDNAIENEERSHGPADNSNPEADAQTVSNLRSWSDNSDGLCGESTQDEMSTIREDQAARDEALDPMPWLRAIDKLQDNAEWGLKVEDALTTELVPKPIHVMGLNKYGNFIAQSLASSGKHVTLLMHRPLLMQDWHDEGESIRLLRNGEIQTTSGFSVESTAVALGQDNPDSPVFKRFGADLEHTTKPPDTVIETLFIASNPGIILASLDRVAHRLRPYSTICFCENGLGIIDKVNQVIFPDPAERPNYMLANFTHKLEAGRGRFDVAVLKNGVLSCTKLPRLVESIFDDTALKIQRKYFTWPATSKYLVGALLEAPDLNTRTLGHKTFHRNQLMNVAMHTLIDSISVAFEVKCEELLYNYKISQYMKMVLGEISLIIRALPEVNTLPQVDRDFSVERMQSRANHILRSQGDKYTDFLTDIRQGRIRTGMDFYSGYLLDRAKKLRIQCPVLESLMLQVEGRAAILQQKG